MQTIDDTPLILIETENSTFGIPALQVRELIESQPITPMPTKSDSVLGVAFWRGSALPILDLGRLLGCGPTERTANERFIIVEFNEHHVGLQANKARNFVELPNQDIRALPPEQSGRRGVTAAARSQNKMVLLVDLSVLLESALESESTTTVQNSNKTIGETA